MANKHFCSVNGSRLKNIPKGKFQSINSEDVWMNENVMNKALKLGKAAKYESL